MICAGQIIQAQEFMIMKNLGKNNSIQQEKTKFFSQKFLIAKIQKLNNKSLDQVLMKLKYQQKKQQMIILNKTMMVNLLDRSHNHFFQKQEEVNFGKMKLKLLLQDKLMQKIQVQDNITMRKKRMILRIKLLLKKLFMLHLTAVMKDM